MKLRPKAAIDRLAHRPRDDDPARRRFGLQTSGNVHPVPVKVVAIDNKVAQMQTHAEYERGVCGLVSVGVGHCLLELDGGTQRINGAGELDQGAVARQLDKPASMACQHWLEVLFAMFP